MRGTRKAAVSPRAVPLPRCVWTAPKTGALIPAGGWASASTHRVSSAQLQMPMITYTDSIAAVVPEALRGFFVGWPTPPTEAAHLAILRASDRVVLALDVQQVVGFVTVLSDGVLCAHVSLLEVLPRYQGRGIGSELMRRVVGGLSNLYAVDVVCDPEVQPFYLRLGMRPAVGMMLRRTSSPAGAPDQI